MPFSPSHLAAPRGLIDELFPGEEPSPSPMSLLLWRAIRGNRAQEALALIARGADPAAPINGGLSPLMVAAKLGFEECVRALIPFGGLGARDAAGRCPLILAAGGMAGERVVAALLEADPAQALVADFVGGTALIHAASKGKAACVRALLAASDPRAAGPLARTALMECSRLGMDDCVALLLDRSDIEAVDAEGMDAASLADHSGFGELSALIASFSAEGPQQAFAK
jgi:ankyrin repeat protein